MSNNGFTRFLVFFAIHHIMMSSIHGWRPECVVIPGTGNSESKIAVYGDHYSECLNTCLEREVRGDVLGINGITFDYLKGSISKCWCHINMVDITTGDPSVARTCFLGPLEEDLSLTLISRPNQLNVVPGSKFTFGFSVSYASLGLRKITCSWRGDYSGPENRKAMQRVGAIEPYEDLEPRSNAQFSRGNSYTHSYHLHPTIDGTQEFVGGYFHVKILNQSLVDGNQVYLEFPLLMNDIAEHATDELFTSFRLYMDGAVYIRHAYIRQHDPDDPTYVAVQEYDLRSYGYRDLGSPPGHIHYPDVTIYLRNIGNTSMSDHSITLTLPSDVEADYESPHVDDHPKLHTYPCLHGTITRNSRTNKIAFYFPFTSPAHIERCQLNIRWRTAENDLTLSRRNKNSKHFSVFVEQKYCPYKQCSSSNMYVLNQRTWQFKWMEKTIFGDYKKFRVKNRYSGTCWSIDPETKKVVGSASCTTNFYESKRYLYSDNSNAPITHQDCGIGRCLYAENRHETMIYKMERYLVWLKSTGVHCITEMNVTSRFISMQYRSTRIYGDACVFDDNSLPSPVKLLSGLDRYDKYYLRSLLVTSESSGTLTIVCNPGGKSGSRYNCFKQTQTSWKAFDSSITNINFYIPDTDILYGLRDRGKSHFKLVDGNIMPILPAEYNTEMTHSQSVHAESFDESVPIDEPQETMSDANIGVSAKGLFRKSDGGWQLMFIWGY